jgi:tRNA pseudouridine synthase 10
MGHGRPFLVKANTCFQNIDTNKVYQRNGIEITFEDIQSGLINNWRTYRQMVDLLVLLEGEIGINICLESLIKNFVGDVRFKMNKKLITKRIYESRLVAIKSSNHFEIRLVLDNGIPIKQLVGGQDPIQPSLTQYLKVPCECIYFDIVDVFQNN